MTRTPMDILVVCGQVCITLYFLLELLFGKKTKLANRRSVLSGANTHKRYLAISVQVKHSRRMNEPPLKPWIAAEKTGTVSTAHCTCMAGLRETCSRAAALMFAVMSGVRMRDDTPCTSLPCRWLQPTQRKYLALNCLL